jgi:hypothetical protein
MPFTFSDSELQRVADALGVAAKRDGSTHRFELSDAASGRRLVLEIQAEVALPFDAQDQPRGLVSVYGMNSFLQLQGVTGMIASEDLGEVIFFARRGGATSGLVVERGAGCSLYSNVDERMLAADFTQLP